MTIHDLVKEAVPIEANNWVLPILWGIARLCPGGVFGEIGFSRGTSALALLIAAEECDGHVYSMDIVPCWEGRDRIQAADLYERFSFIQGDSAVMRFPEELDLLFIDGSHEYSDVKMDYERHRDRVRTGGVILFHDPVSWPGVGRFLEEIRVPFFRLGAGLGMEVKA